MTVWPMHLMTVELGNACGEPSRFPAGARATNLPAHVTCLACLAIMDHAQEVADEVPAVHGAGTADEERDAAGRDECPPADRAPAAAAAEAALDGPPTA